MILDALDDLNWLAVATATAAAFAIGLAWFAPASLGTLWARQVERYAGTPVAKTTADAGQGGALGAWLATITLNAIVLALAAEAIGVNSVGDGVVLGLVLGVGLGTTLASWPAIFARMPLTWWLLNGGCFLLMEVAMGTILGGWQ